MSEDISYRQRRYLISMGVRVVAFLLAVFLFHGVWRFIAAAIALVVPYFAVVFANGGREPDNSAAFEPFEPNLPQRSAAYPASPAPAAGDPAAENTTARSTGPNSITSSNAANGNTADNSGAHGNTTSDSTTDNSGARGGGMPPGAAAGFSAADNDTADRHQTSWNAARHGHPGRHEASREGEAFLSRKQADTRS